MSKYGDILTMFKEYRVRDVIRIPPEYFDLPLEEAALRVLREKYEGVIDRDLGLIIAVYDVKVDEEGIIVPGDGATYHNAEFSLLVFAPMVKETIEGEVVEVTEFGAFVNLGPVDGLIHKSQIMEDRVYLDRYVIRGEKTKKALGKGDIVRAKITGVSMSSTTRTVRIHLTMKPPFMGKLSWIEEELKKIYEKKKS